MMGETSVPGSEARLELFVRSSAPTAARERQSATVERLHALDAENRIEEVVVHSWEKRVPTEGRGVEDTREVYAAFSAWAREHDVDLCPFFDTRECHSSITGESHTALVLPVMCLAVYDDDRLRSVFPHATEERSVAVGDALDVLEDGRTTMSPVGTP